MLSITRGGTAKDHLLFPPLFLGLAGRSRLRAVCALTGVDRHGVHRAVVHQHVLEVVILATLLRLPGGATWLSRLLLAGLAALLVQLLLRLLPLLLRWWA